MGSRKNKDSDSILIQSLLPLNFYETPITSQQSKKATSRGTANNNKNSQRSQTRRDEEAKIEREIIKAITSGKPELLKPNSGQAIQIGEHYVCVSSREETESRCKVWEWHGHVVCYSVDSGYTQEYVYGGYFERLINQSFYEENEEEGSGAFGSRPLFGGWEDLMWKL